MYQDYQVYAAGGSTLWCAVKCGTTCAAGCFIDGPGPLDVVSAAYGLSSWGGK